MYGDSRPAMYRSFITLVILLGALTLVMSVLGHTKKVAIDIPDKALSAIEGMVPSGTFAMYVSADTVPQSAVELRHFDLDVASSDTAVNGVQISQELGMDGCGQGAGQRDYIQYNTLLICPRTDKAPPFVVEVVLE